MDCNRKFGRIFGVIENGAKDHLPFYHKELSFTSNTINDIDINGLTGEVFIATSKEWFPLKE